MSQPAVTITELDGALGVLPPSAGALYALVGVSSSGAVDTPATYARITDIVADFGAGPLVEAAAHFIERYGRPVVLVRTGQTTAGAYGTIVDSGVTGTATVTATAATEPLDDYEVKVRITVGGTLGTGPISYQYSLDDGRTWSPVQSLGTGLVIAIPGTGVSFDLDTGETVVTGDSWTCRTTAPAPNSTELGTALDALKASAALWREVHITCPIDATLFDQVDGKVVGMAASGKYRSWIGNVRMPIVGESEATYLASVAGVFASKATVHGALCAGAVKMISSVSGRQYKRPVSFIAAAREASVSDEINTADVNLGTLVGATIRDVNGNPDEHDESANPGLDDARFYVLRSWEGIAGVYVNRPRLFSAEGSDFQLVPHRRVLNLAHAVLRNYFIRRLNRPVRVDATTGFILEADALEIESGARAVLRAALRAKPKASGIQFALSRTDNLLSTKTMTGQARVIPLAYPETITLDLGFLNPALQVIAA